MATDAPSPETLEAAKTLLSMATTTATAEPPEYTGDAAARVFAVPKLLEHILFTAVTEQKADSEAARNYKLMRMWLLPGCGRIPKGGICLLKIQRVSQAFRHTIQGSTKLKQFLFLKPRENTEILTEFRNTYAEEMLLHLPLVFLLSEMSLWEEGLQFYDIKVVDGIMTMHTLVYELFDLPTTPYAKTIGELPQDWLNAEASWRDMRLCNAKVPSPLNLRVSDNYPDENGTPPFDITLHFEKDDTLEHVFNLFDGLLPVLGEYRDKRKALEDVHRVEKEAHDDTSQSEQTESLGQIKIAMEKRHDDENLQLQEEFDGALKHRISEIQESKARH